MSSASLAHVYQGRTGSMSGATRPLPLDGIRILDLTRVLSGPFATLLLADLGAEIIKVEEPTAGDITREMGPHLNGESHYFLSMNRSKKSIALDLKSTADRDLCKALAAKSDVIIENFRPGVMDRLGLSYAELAQVNPRIIMCSISGFGSGQAAATPAFDITMQALSGAMSINGEADGPPMRLGIPIADLSSGLFAVIGITAALREREVTNLGRNVDVAMYRCMVSLLSYMSGYYFMTGTNPGRVGNGHHTVGPLGVFTTANGQIVLGIMTDRFWKMFCEAIDHEELLTDPRFVLSRDRANRTEELAVILNSVLSAQSTEHWEALLLAVGIPHARIKNIGEVLDDPMTTEIGMVREVEHSVCGTLRVLGSVLNFSDSKPSELTPPPLLGQDSRQILSEILGLSDCEISRRGLR
jgi:crotonobetainyl-CoA:carnitine CoA-transferase CaiB-like acyl-CoA transferase